MPIYVFTVTHRIPAYGPTPEEAQRAVERLSGGELDDHDCEPEVVLTDEDAATFVPDDDMVAGDRSRTAGEIRAAEAP